MPDQPTILELRSAILDANRQGTLPVAICRHYRESRDDLTTILVELHNEGRIDLVTGLGMQLVKFGSDYDFFTVRNLFQHLIPKLIADVEPLMECVRHLTVEAQGDMTAGFLYGPFGEYCDLDDATPRAVLNCALARPKDFGDFIQLALLSGAKKDSAWACNTALGLAMQPDLEVRISAVYALGRLPHPDEHGMQDRVMQLLRQLAQTVDDDRLLAATVSSCLEVFKTSPDLTQQHFDIIETSLQKAGVIALHSAAQMIAYDTKKFTRHVIEGICVHLVKVSPASAGTLQHIDFAMGNLLVTDMADIAMDLLGNYLEKHAGEVAIASFSHTTQTLRTQAKEHLQRFATRSLLQSRKGSCRVIEDMCSGKSLGQPQLQFDADSIPDRNRITLVFMARKAIGYFFAHPVTAASLVVSLFPLASCEEDADAIAMLLHDPMLRNYSGDLLAYLKTVLTDLNGYQKHSLQKVIDAHDEYINALKSVPRLSELRPSVERQQLHARAWRAQMEESLQEAMKGSIMSLFPRATILYGRSSIAHIQHGLDQTTRTEIPLHPMTTGYELPRSSVIDPVGLDHMLRVFRVERLALQ